jgi:hypothetical protein
MVPRYCSYTGLRLPNPNPATPSPSLSFRALRLHAPFPLLWYQETSQYAPVRPSFYIHKPEKYAAPKKETCSAHDPAFAPVHK